MTVDGRWADGWFIWSCSVCGCARTARQAPSSDEARCLRCRAGDATQLIQQLVDKLQNERDEWMGRATKAERENGALLDELFDLKQQLSRKEEAA